MVPKSLDTPASVGVKVEAREGYKLRQGLQDGSAAAPVAPAQLEAFQGRQASQAAECICACMASSLLPLGRISMQAIWKRYGVQFTFPMTEACGGLTTGR